MTSYADIEGTTRCLEDNSIDTIVSAIAIESDETSQGQIDLITAADKSRVTTRFVPSEYGFIATEEYVVSLLLSATELCVILHQCFGALY